MARSTSGLSLIVAAASTVEKVASAAMFRRRRRRDAPVNTSVAPKTALHPAAAARFSSGAFFGFFAFLFFFFLLFFLSCLPCVPEAPLSSTCWDGYTASRARTTAMPCATACTSFITRFSKSCP